MKVTNILYNGKIHTFEFKGDEILKITKGIDKTAKIDACGSFVSLGWIDSHVHIAPNLNGWSADADLASIKKGVATVIDAGSCGWNNFHILEQHAKKAVVNIFYLVNISKNGLTTLEELKDNKLFNKDKTIKVINKNKRAVGIKVRLSSSTHKGNYGSIINIANEISTKAKTPLYSHIGNMPPTLEEITTLLNSSSILGHIFHPKKSGIKNNIKQLKIVKSWKEKGGKTDIAHGSSSFSVDVAKYAIKNNLYPDIISTDIYAKNSNFMVFNLALVMSKLLECGMSVKQIIESVTTKPIKIFNLPYESKIKEGYKGSLTFYKVLNKPKKVIDSVEKEFEIKKQFIPIGLFHNGKWIESEYE